MSIVKLDPFVFRFCNPLLMCGMEASAGKIRAIKVAYSTGVVRD